MEAVTEEHVPVTKEFIEQLVAEMEAEEAALASRTPEDLERARRELVEMLDELDEEFGKPSEEADAWARRVLGL
jgi:hypothetical protein